LRNIKEHGYWRGLENRKYKLKLKLEKVNCTAVLTKAKGIYVVLSYIARVKITYYPLLFLNNYGISQFITWSAFVQTILVVFWCLLYEASSVSHNEIMCCSLVMLCMLLEV